MKILNLLFLIIIFKSSVFGQQVQTQVPIVYNPEPVYKNYKHKSLYLLMRDGVKIAVDLYLPKGLKKKDKIPTIISQTRYWRSIELTPLIKWLADAKVNQPGNRIGYLGKWFPAQGYAWMDVDVRGTGASGGVRAWDLSPVELDDADEIVHWIVNQSWSNGKMGATGLSYSSETSERLLIHHPPAVQAVAARFNGYDFYTDLAFPGGVPNHGFFRAWGQVMQDLDHNRVPTFVPKEAVKYVRGVRRVSGERKYFKQVLIEHDKNYDFAQTMYKVTHRDDFPLSLEDGKTEEARLALQTAFKGLAAKFGENYIKNGVDIASTHTYQADIAQANVPVYCYSGWFDGGFAHAAIKKMLNYTHPNNQLILGPWDHGGFYNISPTIHQPEIFDHKGELLKFFDANLKGKQHAFEQQPRVAYYTMGEEKWKMTDSWPPAFQSLTFYFAENQTLSLKKPTHLEGKDTYQVDTTAGTGEQTRWSTAIIGALNNPYPDRKTQDAKLLCYTSAPLTENMDVTGHPVVTLQLRTTAEDGIFIVYLEMVDTLGKVHYLTEGLLRGIHRKLSTNPAPYKTTTPYHSFLRADAAPMLVGEVNELTFDLLPVSFLFKKGQRIRIAIAGADSNNFPIIPARTAPVWEVERNRNFYSNIILPVVK